MTLPPSQAFLHPRLRMKVFTLLNITNCLNEPHLACSVCFFPTDDNRNRMDEKEITNDVYGCRIQGMNGDPVDG